MRRNPLIAVGALLAAAVGGGLFWLRRRWRADYPDAESLLQNPAVDAVAMRTQSGNVELRWLPEAPKINIYGGDTPARFTRQPVEVIYGGQLALLENAPAKDYRYHLLEFEGEAHDGERLIVAERELPLEGAVNFRDIGGYRAASGRYLRWNRVYRAGQLSGLTAGDHQRLQAMGIQLSCDLRSHEEAAAEPDELPPGVRYVHDPVESDEPRLRQLQRLLTNRGQMDAFMTEVYTQLLVDEHADVYGRVFERLADLDNLPIVLHCTAGKDRTGIAVALLLAYLGVPDDVILADYSLSNRHFQTFVQTGERAIQSVARLGLSVETMLPLFTANPATMAATLDYIRVTYGSVEGYLTDAAGVDRATLDRVRENLLH